LEIATGVSGHGGKLALARPTKVRHLVRAMYRSMR
jgi:hypothetical protein